MGKGILGKKLGMTQVFDDEGRVVPVTVIEADSCVVVQVKTEQTDGYSAVQIGFEKKSERAANQPETGHFRRAGVEPRRHLREFRGDWPDAEPGQEVGPEMFSPGERVRARGISRGKGFAGSIKRHGFSRGPMSHGSRYHRGPGSLGASAFPARVYPGRKLPGRMGSDTVSVRGLEVVRVDPERGLLLLKGSVPGPKGGIVEIEKDRS
ncbi:MAG: 50S ribosomal protein L3 [Bacillota bacterium]